MVMTQSKSVFNLRISLLDGAAAATDIAVTGIATSDTIVFCGHLTTKAAIESLADITSEVSITSAGNIQLSSTATTNDQLWLYWMDNSL